MIHPEAADWNKLEWRRRLETFGDDDSPVVATGTRGEVDSIWYVSSEWSGQSWIPATKRHFV